jgi:hypothetical protein
LDNEAHVLQPLFGVRHIGEVGPLERTAEELSGPERNGFKIEMLVRVNYDTQYGIFPHDDPNAERQNPLALVMLHEKEKVEPHTGLYKMQARFVEYRVAHHSGMSFDQFIQQPRDVVEHWFAICRRAEAKAIQGNNNITTKMEEALSGDPTGNRGRG